MCVGELGAERRQVRPSQFATAHLSDKAVEGGGTRAPGWCAAVVEGDEGVDGFAPVEPPGADGGPDPLEYAVQSGRVYAALGPDGGDRRQEARDGGELGVAEVVDAIRPEPRARRSAGPVVEGSIR